MVTEEYGAVHIIHSICPLLTGIYTYPVFVFKKCIKDWIDHGQMDGWAEK